MFLHWFSDQILISPDSQRPTVVARGSKDSLNTGRGITSDVQQPWGNLSMSMINTGENYFRASPKIIFQCEYCSTTFTTKSGWKAHMDQHEGKFRYSCNICGKGFSKKPNYEGHMNSHLNVRPFQCEICQKTFAYIQSYQKHKNTCT